MRYYINPKSLGKKAVLGFTKKISTKAAKKEIGKVTKKTYKNLQYDAETKQWKCEDGKPIRPNAKKVENVKQEKATHDKSVPKK
ncbi:hypothetical protein [Priestia flexa]|uniref:hypothetical protein n=1 Tax=Priestia flexa TaxID=86664 RepID=UPI00099D8916|nr:hypothetical protein [Priestia flexa]AQX56030.1 hypothetical protein BC359_18110 [Priestia flexa]